jgi:uncharacterized protein
MLHRNIEQHVKELLKEYRIVAISGPRQSGKTTLVKHLAEQLNMHYLTFDDSDLLSAAASDPKGFVTAFSKRPVVIDEVQMATEILPYIKQAVDENNAPGQFLFTGSTDIFAMSRVTESLAGRMVRTILYPFSIAEKRDNKTNLVDALLQQTITESIEQPQSRDDIFALVQEGGYPEMRGKNGRVASAWYKSYLDARIKRDLGIIKRISSKNRSQINQLLKLCAVQCANLINISSLSSGLRIDSNTVRSDLELLEALYIVKRLKPFSTNLGKREVKTPKLHFIDSGLASWLTGSDISRFENSKIRGQMTETFVFGELQKAAAWSQAETNLFHYRTNTGYEVDFVLESKNKMIGVEVKSGSNLKRADFRGLVELKKNTGSAFSAGYVFYNGEHVLSRKVDNDTFWMIPLQALG